MSKFPLITIIIPSYNHGQYIGKAIQSVIDQKYSNWELIVVDNNSTDNTDKIVNGFLDSRIHIIKIHNEGIIGKSRNTGILHAKGDWIAFLDSDDCWYPSKLEVVTGAIVSDEKLDVICNDELMVNIGNGKSRILRHGPYETNFYRVLLLDGNRLSPSATVVRRAFIEKHNVFFSILKKYITVEDYDFWMNLALKNANFKFINEVHGEYTIHGGNTSSKFEIHLANLKNLLHNHVFFIQDFTKNDDLIWRLIMVRLNLIQFIHYISVGRFKLAVQALKYLSKENPSFLGKIFLKKISNYFNGNTNTNTNRNRNRNRD
jgi:glycosyltransferase involved in cell wall biosynthesis